MTEVKNMNMMCWEYLSELSGRSRYRKQMDGRSRGMIRGKVSRKRWYEIIISDAFVRGCNPTGGSFWDYLGRDDELFSRQETLDMMTDFVNNYHLKRCTDLELEYTELEMDDFVSRRWCKIEHLVSDYGKALTYMYPLKARQCIDTKEWELDRVDNENRLNECIIEKMSHDDQFEEWVGSGSCFNPMNMRTIPKTPPKLTRQTCEPVNLILSRLSIKMGYTFAQMVKRFERDMRRLDLDSVKVCLEGHYPNFDVSELATACIERRLHPTDFDFGSRNDVDEWNKIFDLCPQTPTKIRRSERVGSLKRKHSDSA